MGDDANRLVREGKMSITWNNRIKAMFDNSYWIQHMKQVSGGDIDLSSYQSVKANGPAIYKQIS